MAHRNRIGVDLGVKCCRLLWPLVAVVLGVLGSDALGATLEHAGPIAADTTWSSTDDHLVTGDVRVTPGATLTIEPGTVVRFAALSDSEAGGDDAALAELIVEGSLLANGTVDQPITFTSDATAPGKGDWLGIRQRSRLPFELRHAIVEYFGTGVDSRVDSAVVSRPVIEHVVFRQGTGHGCYFDAPGRPNLLAILGDVTVEQMDGRGIYGPVQDADSIIDFDIQRALVHHVGSDGIRLHSARHSNLTQRLRVVDTGCTLWLRSASTPLSTTPLGDFCQLSYHLTYLDAHLRRRADGHIASYAPASPPGRRTSILRHLV